MANSPLPEPRDGLVTRSRPWAEGTLLTLLGELDHDSADDLRSALDDALRPPGTVLVIDCAGLGFCDSTGLDTLLRAQARAAAEGSRIDLARPRPLVRWMLQRTGTAELFSIRDAPPA
ncbi:STAS domain-containing protein [Kitasatospora sp. NPDC018058]|uniref:STAS domain-containing protein n=1 Tax=Kitasatospora sp. NPDC018058 TaxID=3364025 RepID=UPI0037C0C30C